MHSNISEFKIKQSSKLVSASKRYWQWAVWIDAKDELLDNINNVEYILHPSFKNRVRNINSRRNNFKLQTKGWGEFTIFIRIYFKGSTPPIYLTHDLILFSDKIKNQKRVFISSQLKNKEEEENLKHKLQKENFKVSTKDTLDSSPNFSETIMDSIDESDIVIMLGDEISKGQEFEMFQALDSKKDVYMVGQKSKRYSDINHLDSTDDLMNLLEGKKDSGFF